MSNDYKTGFNAGFVITEHLPDLARAISKTDSASPWFDGFRDGHKEYHILEQIKEHARQEPFTMRLTWLDSDMSQNHQPDQPEDPEQEWDRDVER